MMSSEEISFPDYVVVVGRVFGDHTPDEAVVGALTRAAKKCRVVVAVASGLASIKSIDLPENVRIIPDDPEFVFAHRFRPEPAGGCPSYQARQQRSAYSERVEFLRETTGTVAYLCADPSLASNTFELAALVHTSTFAGRRWLADGDNTIPDVMSRIGDAVEYPNFIIPERGSEGIVVDRRDAAAFRNLMLEGICVARAHLRAGYCVLKNACPVPGWAVQTGTTFITLVIDANQITPGEPDFTHQQAMFESATFRKAVCDGVVSAVGHYLHSIGIATPELLKESLREEKEKAERGVGPLAFKTYGEAVFFPGTEYHDDLVAWNSYRLFDRLYDIYERAGS